MCFLYRGQWALGSDILGLDSDLTPWGTCQGNSFALTMELIVKVRHKSVVRVAKVIGKCKIFNPVPTTQKDLKMFIIISLSHFSLRRKIHEMAHT